MKKNRFNRRQEKRRRVYSYALMSDEIAYYDPASKQVEVIKMMGRERRMVSPHLIKSPTFAELHKVAPGSAAERSYLNERMMQGLPRYHDVKTGTMLG